MLNATKQQLDFMDSELPRFLQSGAWEPGQRNRWVSRMFLVPKPGENKWRLIIDLRPLNKYCKDHKLTFETLKHLKNLTRAGDWMVSFDLADGYYTLGIREEDRDFFTVNYRGTLYRLAGLPMGWKCSSYYFCRLTEVFIRHLREPLLNPTVRNPRLATQHQPTRPTPSRRYLRNSRWRGVRLLPYMDDFLFFADSRDAALQLRDRVACLLDRLGLGRNPKKGHWEPTQICEHLGLQIDTTTSTFRAPVSKLQAIATLARTLLQRSTRDARWLPARQLAVLAGKAQYLYLAIPAARFYLRELHDVLATRTGWGGRVQLTYQLRRDLQWWTQVPSANNGRSIFSPIETAYLHCDSSGYGWGAVLNEQLEARGFWSATDQQ